MLGHLKNKYTNVILDSIVEGVFTVDTKWRITSFNRAAEKITRIPTKEAIGKQCWDVFRASICEKECPLRQTLKTGKPTICKTIYIIDAEGNRIPVSISTALLRDETGQVIGGVETFHDLSLVTELRKEIEKRHAFADIISKNHQMLHLFDILIEVARSSSTVLIEGESGTGKELFARAIHNLSPRRNKPLVVINCAALPDTLLESELFGYKAGAFTDAKKDKPGRFALAKGGTIFLDEIGDISPALQVRLLRILQEKTYEPLGSLKTVKADVRIITATNRDLATLVKEGKFRQDLYYRINVVRLVLPPLRERKEDIPLLIEHFITHFNRLNERNIKGVSPDALAIMMKHNYPGNIRELENIVEHAFVLCKGDIIEPQHLPETLLPAGGSLPAYARTLKELERQFIIETLKRNNWHRLSTARELGIHKSTLFRKIKSLKIVLPAKDGRTKS